MDTTLLITSFVTLFVIVDPIGLTPIFFSLTQELSKNECRLVAKRSVIIASAILLFFQNFWRNNTQLYWNFHASF